MSKLGCTCGHVISDVRVPNEVTGLLVSYKDSETFFDFVASATADLFQHIDSGRIEEWRAKHFSSDDPQASPAEMLEDVLQSRLLDLSRALMECEACGRLYVQQAPCSNQYRGYQPEPGEPEVPHVLGPLEGGPAETRRLNHDDH